MLELIIQIILAIFLVLIMGFIAYSIFDKEYLSSIRLTSTNKKSTMIIDGIYSFTEQKVKIETVNKYHPHYIEIIPSVNQNGGAEYTYNFWLYFNTQSNNNIIDDAASSDKYILLFYKGLNTLISYPQYKYATDTLQNDTLKKYIMIKNPLIKISNNYKNLHLLVEYNNINYPDTYISTNEKIKENNTNENIKNKIGIKEIDSKKYNKTWNMITVIIQENSQNEDELFKNKTNCKIYFNGTLITDRTTYNNELHISNSTNTKSSVMKNNIGNLYLNYAHNNKDYTDTNFHNGAISSFTESDGITKDSPLKIANLSYYNYALPDNEIIALYSKGFTKKISDIITRDQGLNSDQLIYGSKINTAQEATDLDGKEIALPIQPI